MTDLRVLYSDFFNNELTFSASRSSGPGGQNVNKVNSKVTLRWNLLKSLLLTPERREVLLHKLSTHLTGSGELVIHSQNQRSQLQNKEEVLKKFDLLLAGAFAKKKKRKPTKPKKSAVQSRLDKKKKHSEKKKFRQSKF
ncbi:MAG: aminoacyl-tRNA hydrolase [Bacteroidetes bacterium]|nr:aminoacyl-tRNA hydrolase [Bacteroidota bacterium]